MAGTCSAIQGMVSGRPLTSTTTVGVPVAWIAFTKSSCRPGRSSEAREAASPLISADSPTTTMATSAWRAMRTASAISLEEQSAISHPRA